jgi:hypothetical protein
MTVETVIYDFPFNSHFIAACFSRVMKMASYFSRMRRLVICHPFPSTYSYNHGKREFDLKYEALNRNDQAHVPSTKEKQ